METTRPDSQISPGRELQAMQELVGTNVYEIIQVCGESLEQLAHIPERRKSYDYESFSAADRSESLRAAEERLRALDAATFKPVRPIPSTRAKMLVPNFSARQQAIEEGRQIVPELRATLERGLERCQIDAEVASELVKEAAESIDQLSVHEDITYMTADQRSYLIAELLDAAEKLAEGDLKLPWRTPVKSLRACLDFETKLIYQEISELVGNPQFAKRIEAEIRRRIMQKEYVASMLAQDGRLLQIFNNAFARKAAEATRQHHRSPNQLAEVAHTIDTLQSEVHVASAQCQSAYTMLDSLKSRWMSQLSGELLSSVKFAESQLAIWRDILARGEGDLDPTELNTSIEDALGFITGAKERFAAFLPTPEVYQADEAKLATTDEDSQPSVPSQAREISPTVKTVEKEPLDPELEKALRLGVRVLNGGGKLEKSTRCKQWASGLATIKLEVGKQRKTVESLFRKYECGVIMAILTDNFDQFEQLVDQIQSAWRNGHDYAEVAGTEWLSDIRSLQTINLKSVTNNIKTIIENTGTRNRLMGVLSETEFIKLRDKLRDIAPVDQ